MEEQEMLQPSDSGSVTMETVSGEIQQAADPGSDLTPSQSSSARETCPAVPCAIQNQNQNQFVIVEQQGTALQCEHMVILTGQSEGREVFVIPSNQLVLPASQLVSSIIPTGVGVKTAVPVTMVTDSSSQPAAAVSSQDVSCCLKPLPSSAPNWAKRLRDAEKLGDSYRGYCSSEVELEAILFLHKQQSGCVFGTRQSPSVDKPATRLMWKSQYVPYDGIPFVNTGSRAIVMECQFGPRRKGTQPKKNTEQPQDYKATCPARIYIKKVRKFPEYGVPVEPTADRQRLRQKQGKAFSSLRNKTLNSGGVIRFYVQLPTEKAHLYHDVDMPIPPPPPDLPPTQDEEEEQEEEEEQGGGEDGSCIPSRLHPRVAERIRQLVAEGQHHVYGIRRQLRHFVEQELFKSEGPPERHNLCFFPTINDIKNHIHESQKALGLGGARAEWPAACSNSLTDTVTLTLTPAAAEALDGSDTLSPEAIQLFSSLSSLQPKIFAQLQEVQLQPAATPPRHKPPGTSVCSSSSSSVSPSHSLIVSPSSFLHTSQNPPGQCAAACEPLLEVSAPGDAGSARMVLQSRQTIPVQIVNTAAVDLSDSNLLQVEVKEEEEGDDGEGGEEEERGMKVEED